MEKNTFFVITYRHKETGKQYSTAQKVANCNNLLGYFKAPKDFEILSINACDTWKEAIQIAIFWDSCAAKNGNYYYS